MGSPGDALAAYLEYFRNNPNNEEEQEVNPYATVWNEAFGINPPETQSVKPTWIIWSPASDKPPTRVFSSRIEAFDVAKIMAMKFGGTFHVCRLVGEAVAPVGVVLRDYEA